jgi:predicted Rossmann fold nucleotide-binding protein DprA/Smf involved in DNA uptake
LAGVLVGIQKRAGGTDATCGNARLLGGIVMAADAAGKRSVVDADVEARVLRAAGREALTVRELAEAVGLPVAVVRRAVNRLHAAGRIQVLGVGPRNAATYGQFEDHGRSGGVPS